MAEEGLKIKIGADTAELQQGLQKAGTAIQEFSHKTSYATFLARDAALDLGHVFRDLPYAMSNPGLLTGPIDRVAQLFTQISAQSGGAVGALKAIGGVLSGPSGILIGFELLQSAAALFFGRTSEGSKKAQKDVFDLKQEMEDISKIAGEAAGSEAGNIAQIQSLASVVANTNNAYSERKNALTQLREINKAYFGDLTLEDAATGKLQKSVEEYTKALVAQAVVKKYVNDIADTAVKKADAEEEKLKALIKVQQAQALLNKANVEALSEPTGAQGVSDTRAQISASNDLTKAQIQLIEAKKAVADIDTKQQALTDRLNKAQEDSLQFKSLKTDAAGPDALKAQIEATERLRNELDKLGFDSTNVTEKLIKLKEQLVLRDAVKLGLSAQEISLQITALERELQDAFDKQGARFEIKARPSLDIKTEDLSKIAKDADKLFNPFSKAVDDLIKRIKPKLTDIIPKETLDRQVAAIARMQKLTEEAKNLGGALDKNLKPAFDVFFDDIISGKGSQAFADLGKAIEDVIKKLIIAAAEAEIFNLIIGAFTGGAGAGGAGFGGASGFGKLFSQFSGISLNSVAAPTGLALHSVNVVGTNTIRGQDLLTIFTRVNNSNNRLH